jgi:hypothetical protein
MMMVPRLPLVRPTWMVRHTISLDWELVIPNWELVIPNWELVKKIVS